MKLLAAIGAVVITVGLTTTAVAQSGTSADRRDSVQAVQQALKDKGYDPGAVDGRMGPKTHAAVRDFQKKEGLRATGRVDRKTAEKLGVQARAETRAPAGDAASAQPTAPREAKKPGPGASSTTPYSELGKDAAATKKPK
jgi:peptidoglycan hydrolase-like protein with peptidoglycan-binding domain